MTVLSTSAQPRGKTSKTSGKRDRVTPTRSSRGSTKNAPQSASEVLTLSEAANYLRVSNEAVLELAEAGQLPGRQIGADWRFFKTALQVWLSRMPSRETTEDFWSANAGAFRDDPDLAEMLEQIYAARGRAMTE